ncbi:hypothetical protein GGS23DRAFT_160573 [Durotheca rogersii]|uniref:uncharacterized protein n=1 Tax=Durotheca rogersii TaxID=419775 RepID=UPI00221F5494|nr:uncharacterized protein GGS23DRAFT_160573 [Durotheca rogersii]KAI5861274.1 hypothetical protein GGS23DRAFT_160573 [Durotheca rogersii]
MAPERTAPIVTTAIIVAFIVSLADTALVPDRGRFGVIDDAPLFPDADYPPGMGPRYFVDLPVSAKPRAARRQQSGACGAGNHTCLELGPLGEGLCCDNDAECIVLADWSVRCCPLGSCSAPCHETLRYCNITATETTTIATSGTVLTAVETTSLIPACCERPCSSSSFLCPQNLGGRCCPYGASCRVDGSCAAPLDSSSSGSAVITPLGCTTSQITCAESEGGGCCNTGSTCTSSVSATETVVFCALNGTVVQTGLSEAARAGVGVGVTVGAAIVIGALTWFCIRRRREAKSRNGGSTLARGTRDGDLVDEFIESEITSPSSGTGRRPRPHRTGLAYQYDGPDAVDGPYTDREGSNTPGRSLAAQLGSSLGRVEQVGVPANHYPERPDGIVRPVEIDTGGRIIEGTGRTPAELGVTEGDGEKSSVRGAAPAKDEDQEVFELYGSPVPSPPPMSPSELEQHRAGTVSPSPLPEMKGTGDR